MNTSDSIVVTGDLLQLSEEERKKFYVQVCDAMQINFRTRPLQYFEQVDRGGRRSLILYALRDASNQLRALHGIDAEISDERIVGDAVVFTATATNNKGRKDSAVGAMSLKGLSGKDYADAIMAAQTKAKRRVTLDISGCGLLDESEVEGMHGSVVPVGTEGMSSSYVPIPAAPTPVLASAPATEVVELKGDAAKVFVDALQNPPAPAPAAIAAANKYAAAVDEVKWEDYHKSVTIVVTEPSIDPKIIAALPTSESVAASFAKDRVQDEQEITSRLNSFRKDTLSLGGMKPSKGFGIAAKWSKFLAKHAPNKTIEEYQTLLIALDLALEQLGPSGVVAKIEQEIA
jgi:hypothetical protein